MQKEEEAKELAAIDPKLLKRRAPVISIMGHVDMVKQHFLIQSAHQNTKLYQLKLAA